MRKLSCQLALGLSLSMMVPFCGQVLAQSADTTIKVSTLPSPQNSVDTDLCHEYKQGEQAAQSIPLYYLREASTMANMLNKFVNVNACMKDAAIESQDENVIVLYGRKEQRKALERIITTLDLPRERVNLEMWGIDISSNNPEQLAKVMHEVNQEIDKTRTLMQETYKRFENDARDITPEDEFNNLLATTLAYRDALDRNRPTLSMIDILLLINAAKQPDNYNKAARNICELFKEHQYNEDVKVLTESNNKRQSEQTKVPFGNYLRVGLHQLEPEPSASQSSSDHLKPNCKGNILASSDRQKVIKENLRIRRAVLNFALQYSDLIERPNQFDPESLQHSAEELNSILNPVVDAINRDVEELFIEPTLKRIQDIVKKYKHVEYAEVGKTSVAGLNGLQSTVSSTTVSAFDETPPLMLNELLTNAVKDLLPSNAASVATNAVPAKSIVSLISVLGKDRTLWRELTSGATMNITPSVLRNSSSAELNIDFITGPKEAGTTEQGVRPLSRISQSNVTTKVYVNTLDLFAISTFNSQTTIDGGRTYIPVIGTIWKGVFSGIPILGNLFSWKNAPKNVQHQNIILTNSFIAPTAMGFAPLYNLYKKDNMPQSQSDKEFYNRCIEVEKYIMKHKNDPEQGAFS